MSVKAPVAAAFVAVTYELLVSVPVTCAAAGWLALIYAPRWWHNASPLLAATLTVFLLSLIGIPITGGFFAKFYVFSAALQANLIGLTIIGVLNSAVASYYYLRIIISMYMREPRDEAPVPAITPGVGVALAISLAATI